MKKFSTSFPDNSDITFIALTPEQCDEINDAVRRFNIERRKSNAAAVKAAMDARLLKR